MTDLLSPSLDGGAGRLSPRAWGALLVLCGALFLDALDVSMVGVALPSIRADLGTLDRARCSGSSARTCSATAGSCCSAAAPPTCSGAAACSWSHSRCSSSRPALGGLASAGTLLIATRFIKGVSAAFTAPAGLSIITTSFAEGPARNKALSIYTATGATGFSLGLVFGGLLTEIGWRWVFFLPVPIALVTLLAALQLVPAAAVPRGRAPVRPGRSGRS